MSETFILFSVAATTYALRSRDVAHIDEAYFRVANRKDPLYSVWIDQRFGVIDEFKDYRREQTLSSHL